jgi:hypothetical protein
LVVVVVVVLRIQEGGAIGTVKHIATHLQTSLKSGLPGRRLPVAPS